MSIAIDRTFDVNDYMNSSLRLTKISGTHFNDINNFTIPTRVFFTSNYVYRTPITYILDSNQVFNRTTGFIHYWNVSCADGTREFPDTMTLPQGDFTAQPLRGYSLNYAKGLWTLTLDLLLYDNIPKVTPQYARATSTFINIMTDNTGTEIQPMMPNALSGDYGELQGAIEDISRCP